MENAQNSAHFGSDSYTRSISRDSSTSTVNQLDSPSVVRRRGRPRLSNRSSNIDVSSASRSRRRPGRPFTVGSSSSFSERVTQSNIHSSISNGITSLTTRRTPAVILSSRTVVGVDGNPVHTNGSNNNSVPIASSSNLFTQRSMLSTIEDHVDRVVVQHPNTNFQRRMMSYWDCGDSDRTCPRCHAILWYEERTIKSYRPSSPKFSICCSEGKVVLPSFQNPPSLLQELMDYHGGQRAKVFREHIKFFNAMFSFTSTGGKIDSDINDGGGPYTFRLNGHNYHRIGSLLPTHDDGRPRFAQLYIYDTDNELDNRFHALHKCIPASSDPSILRTLVQELTTMLDQNNSLVQAFRMAKERFSDSSMQPVSLRLIGTRRKDGRQYNLPTASEVAALIPGDGNPTDCRDVLIEERGTYAVKRITELHPSFMALQYPLLFPYGEDGFHLNIPFSTNTGRRKNVSLREYYCYRLHVRQNEWKTLHRAGRLFHTYVVDCYSAVLENDLAWYKRNQNTIRSELYNGLHDRISSGETRCDFVGRRVILPSTFTGGPRHMLQQYQDAMAICRWAGIPDLFLTMTCNPNWPEISRHVSQSIPGQIPSDRPDIIARVFKIKLDELMRDIKKKKHFGRIKALIYTIEFQKRGLPHCHALIFLHESEKITSTSQIDKFISAELPSEIHNPLEFEVVRAHMMHGPCGDASPLSPCMSGNICTKGFPKEYCDHTFVRTDGWPRYRRPNNGRRVRVGNSDVLLDNRYVVPHNLDLLIKYACHINLEWCNQGSLVKYLFNYLNKGPDRATVVLESNPGRTSFSSLLHNPDEIEEYLNCRYISASEACWKLFAFEMHYRSIPVERLPFHAEGCNRVYFRDHEDVTDVVRRDTVAMSKFTSWFTANSVYPFGRALTYAEFPTEFTWHADIKEWHPRENGFSIGRIYYVNPSAGEQYYLRMLLNVVRGPRSYDEIRTVDGVLYPTYMSACKALNLLGDDTEWFESIRDASQWKFGNQLRELFVIILLFCSVSDHAKLFFDSYSYLSEDILFNQRRLFQNQNLELTDDEIRNYTLIEIDKILTANNKSLIDFPNLPQVDRRLLTFGRNRLLASERTYNVLEERTIFENLFSRLNIEQKDVYNAIISAVTLKKGGLFFVYGSGGTGKTFLWKTLIASIRSHGKIVLSVASSGIASLLLPGGRTAHSRFRIPIEIDENSCCSIDMGSDLAELINVAELIIWDEAPLQNRHAFEAVDRTFRDICRCNDFDASNVVFGGKVVVLGGDFRQILPVISHGKRCDIVNSAINRSSLLWPACKVFVLTTNMRLHDPTLSGEDLLHLQNFNSWILDMGDGRLPAISLDGEDEATWVRIPDDLLIPVVDDSISAVVSNIFPDISNRINDVSYLKERCILCPTNDEVDSINLHVLNMMSGDMHELLSVDSICRTTDNFEDLEVMYPTEFLNSLRFSGVPNHSLFLKVGVPILLLRNLNLQKGLCNGTRLLVSQISRRVIEAVIITGTHVGEKVFIGRIDMTPSDSSWPFAMKRRQFPIKVCFAMTINKSQGQTFNHVCAYITKPVFTHGQLYVAASRVTSRAGLRFYIDNKGICDNNLTKNIVYKEVFSNLR